MGGGGEGRPRLIVCWGFGCNVTSGVTQQWVYNNEEVRALIIPPTGHVSGPQIVDVGGVEIRLSLLSTMNSPYLASQITFVANENGGVQKFIPQYE
jgi:hypothetical protein